MAPVIDKDAFSKLPIVRQFDELMAGYDAVLELDCTKEFLQVLLVFEECRKKWNLAEAQNLDLQEKLAKSDAEKNALIIKLKHARRQIAEEAEARREAEQDRDALDEQIMLVRELLLSSDSNSKACLSEEAQRKLDFLNASRYQSPRQGYSNANRKLHPIDETASILSDYSDISFDETGDDLDSSNCHQNNKRSHAVARRRALGGNFEETSPKRIKADVSHHESIRCTIEGPATMHIEKLADIDSEPVEKYTKRVDRTSGQYGRKRPSREHRRSKHRRSYTTTDTESQSPSDAEAITSFFPHPTACPPKPQINMGKAHNLKEKHLINKETCRSCGKRIQFGKKALKCADCRMVLHIDCQTNARKFVCELKSPSLNISAEKNTLEDYLVSDQPPLIPQILYNTITEIENRGLKEQGLYRVPGMLRMVKQLRQQFKENKVPDLAAVNDVHILCSLVKDFLRTVLKEPLLTFDHRSKFISAARQSSNSAIIDLINDMKPVNRDTLAFIMIHFFHIVDTPETCMSVEGLAKAVGPSFVGYGSPEPSISDIQDAPPEQEAVMTKLLNLPPQFFSDILTKAMAESNCITSSSESDVADLPASPRSRLGPVHSPKTPSSSSIAERAKKYLNHTPFGKSKHRKEGNFFASPY